MDVSRSDSTGGPPVCFPTPDRLRFSVSKGLPSNSEPNSLAARDNQVPFYVAAPSSSIDWALPSGHLIPIEELRQLSYVLREPRSSMRTILAKALSDIGIDQIQIAMEVGSTDTIVEMLQHGRHVSFLPRFAVAEALNTGGLYHIKIQGLRITRTLWIARIRSNLNNPVSEAFIQLLRGEKQLAG